MRACVHTLLRPALAVPTCKTMSVAEQSVPPPVRLVAVCRLLWRMTWRTRCVNACPPAHTRIFPGRSSGATPSSFMVSHQTETPKIQQRRFCFGYITHTRTHAPIGESNRNEEEKHLLLFRTPVRCLRAMKHNNHPDTTQNFGRLKHSVYIYSHALVTNAFNCSTHYFNTGQRIKLWNRICQRLKLDIIV